MLEFAINTNGRRSHPAYPGGFEVDIDTNGDGVADYAVYNAEHGGFGSSGQTWSSSERPRAARRRRSSSRTPT